MLLCNFLGNAAPLPHLSLSVFNKVSHLLVDHINDCLVLINDKGSAETAIAQNLARRVSEVMSIEEVAEDFFEVTVFVDLIEGVEGGRSIKLLEAKEG